MLKEQLQALVEDVLRELQLDPGTGVQMDVPRDRRHGDYSTNIALVLGKRVGRPPGEVARAIVERLVARPGLELDVSLAGPGFINFKLHDSGTVGALRALLERGVDVARAAGRRSVSHPGRVREREPDRTAQRGQRARRRLTGVRWRGCSTPRATTSRPSSTSTTPAGRWISWGHRCAPASWNGSGGASRFRRTVITASTWSISPAGYRRRGSQLAAALRRSLAPSLRELRGRAGAGMAT